MGAQLSRSAVGRHRVLAMVVAVVSVVWSDAAIAERRPQYGGRVVASIVGEPASLDPLAAASHAELSVASQVFDTLYQVDSAGRVRPHLAASLPRVSRDRKTVRIPITAGVRFHDGRVLEVADVVKSLRRAQASRRAQWMLAPVRRIHGGKGELVLELRRDTPELTLLLSAPQLSVTARGAAPKGSRVLGTGPFRLRSLDRGKKRLLLGAHEAHFAGRPYLDEVELRWYTDPDEEARQYERGLTHLSLRGAAAFSGHLPKYATAKVEGPATIMVYVGFGTAHRAVTASLDLRRALSLSLSRNGLKGVGSGERVVPSVYPAAVDIGGEATERAKRDPRPIEAKRALDRARRRVRELRGPLSLEVIIDRTRPDDREVAEKVVAALYRMNLRAKITALSAQSFSRRVARGQCDLYVGHLATSIADPALAVALAFAAGGDDWTQRMLAKARLRPAGARAWFAQRLPVLPLFHRAVRAHYRRNLRGVSFDRAARVSFAGIFQHGPAPLSKPRTRAGARRRGKSN